MLYYINCTSTILYTIHLSLSLYIYIYTQLIDYSSITRYLLLGTQSGCSRAACPGTDHPGANIAACYDIYIYMHIYTKYYILHYSTYVFILHTNNHTMLY